MKIRIIFLVTALLLVGVSSHVAAQETVPQTNQEIITQRCTLAQNYIKDIQKPRDLRARVDRLQAYRYIYQRIDIFTKRLERNSQPGAEDLRSSLDDFSKKIELFKTSYEKYDLAREGLTKVSDCRKNIELFQSKLETARAKRQIVSDSVVSIEGIMSPTIKSQLDTLYQGLLATGKTGALNE